MEDDEVSTECRHEYSWVTQFGRHIRKCVFCGNATHLHASVDASADHHERRPNKESMSDLRQHVAGCQCPECSFWRNATNETTNASYRLKTVLDAIKSAVEAWERKASK